MTDKVQKIHEEVEKLMYGFNLEADIASCEDAETEKLADIKYQLCKKILEYIDSLQEEPVSEGRDIFDNYLKSEEKFILPQKISGNIDCENCLYSSACALGDIQACIIDKPVSENLGEYINELSKQFPEVSFAKLSCIAVRVAKWQEEQDKETIELAEDHAMLAGMEKMKEQMMKDAVDACVIDTKGNYPSLAYGHIDMMFALTDMKVVEGDKVKLIIIKEE